MWIENVAAVDVEKGYHHDAGANSMLIQIADTVDPFFPQAKHSFAQVHRFQFLDIEDGDEGVEEHGITDAQAAEIIALLTHALEHKMNVIVHCVVGMCRSGAVVEVGVMLGFQDTERYRQPNLRVKHKLMQQLGWDYKNS